MVSASATSQRRSYERYIVPFARPFAESTSRRAAHALRPGGLVLDHGAGTGLVASLLLRREPDLRVVALDPNAELLRALADEQRCVRLVGTAADLDNDRPPFDTVVSNLVLPFCPDAAGDLARVRRLTAASGTLVVTTLGAVADVTPFHRFWSATESVIPGAWEPTRYPHHRFGEVDSFVDEITSGGWKVRSAQAVRGVRRISATNAWSWLSSVLPVGVGDAYRAMREDERAAARSEFLGRWSAESRWVSAGWTVVATS